MRQIRCWLLIPVSLAFMASCAKVVTKPPEMNPFSRAVILFYAAGSGQKGANSALDWLELETGKPQMVTIRAFDEHDQALGIEARDLVWTASDNVKVEPDKGSATVKVTLLDTDIGQLVVEAAGHKGTLRIKSKG